VKKVNDTGADPQEYLWMQWNKCDCRAAEAEKGYLEKIKQLEEKEKKLLKEIVDLKRVEPMCHCGIGYSDHRNTENHPFIDMRDNTNYWENPMNKEIRSLQSKLSDLGNENSKLKVFVQCTCDKRKKQGDDCKDCEGIGYCGRGEIRVHPSTL
jgi:hypothetical protein